MTKPPPTLRTSREDTGAKIAERIRAFERLRAAINNGPIRDHEDEFSLQRRYTIELLHSLFNIEGPAAEFDSKTKRSVFYSNPSDAERRHELDDDVRTCIHELRSLTARLDFYDKAQAATIAETTTTEPTTAGPLTPPNTPEHAPTVTIVLLFLAVLILIAGLILWQQDNIARLKGPAQPVFLVIISLVAAVLLLGLFRAVARATGKLFGLKVELGGPAALFIVVLLILTNLPQQTQKPSTDTTGSTVTTTLTAGTNTTNNTTLTAGTSTNNTTTTGGQTDTAPTATAATSETRAVATATRWTDWLVGHWCGPEGTIRTWDVYYEEGDDGVVIVESGQTPGKHWRVADPSPGPDFIIRNKNDDKEWYVLRKLSNNTFQDFIGDARSWHRCVAGAHP